MTIYLVRYSEIYLKSVRTRKRLLNLLITDILRRCKERIQKIQLDKGRIIIEGKEISEILKKVPGIFSFSEAIRVKNWKEVPEAVLKYLKGKKTFAVRVKKSLKMEKSSLDIAAEIGEKILELAPELRVNLDNPDIEINVEIRKSGTYVFFEKIPGLGGLPLESEGRVVSLVSGGTDSSVASVLVLKRGCLPILLHGEMKKFWSGDAYERFYKFVEYFSEFSPDSPVYSFNLEELHEKFRLNNSLRCFFCKACMYKAGEILCKKTGAKAIVTGESLGQVATQTLEALYFLSRTVSIPVFRPVLCWSKLEIESLAKNLNLYRITGKNVGKCSLLPTFPRTTLSKNEFIRLKKEIKRIERNIRFKKIY